MKSISSFRSTPASIAAAAWIALALSIVVVLGSLNIPTLRMLASHGVKAQGTVLALEPTNHQTVRYSYQAGGTTYQGAGTVGDDNPAFGSLNRGDSVLLYYAASAPETSILGQPKPRLQNEISSVAMAALLFPSILVFAFVVLNDRFVKNKRP